MQHFKKQQQQQKTNTVNYLHNAWDAFFGVKLRCASGSSLSLPLSDTVLVTNQICHPLMKCFMSKFSDGFCGPRSACDLDCSPAAAFGVFPRDKGATEAHADGSKLVVVCLVVSTGSSARTGKASLESLLGI